MTKSLDQQLPQSAQQIDDSVFRSLVEGSIQGILVHRDQKPLFINDAWARIYGLTIEEALQLSSAIEVVHPEDRERLVQYGRARLAGQFAPEHYEFRGIHKNGSIVWLENIVRPIVWYGQPAIQAVIIDITQRKLAQQALVESEERFRRGFEHGPIGIYFVDIQLRFIKANRAFSDICGYSEAELQQLTVADLSIEQPIQEGTPGCPDARVGVYRAFTIRKQYLRRDGSQVWCRVWAHWVRDEAGQPLQRMTFVEDISERVDARLKLEASERRFRNLVEGSIQGILVHRDDKPLFANEAWAQLFGYSVEEVLRYHSTLPFLAEHEKERLQRYRLARFNGDSAPQRYEYQGRRKNGTLFWLENNVRVVEWDGLPAIQSTIIDISERKMRESELQSFNEELKRRVAERTSELESALSMLKFEMKERERFESELRESRTLYESLVETIPLCVARKNIEGDFLFVNRALRAQFGKPLEEIVGQNDYAFSPPELAKQYQEADRRIIETGELSDFTETINFGPEQGERHIHTLKTPTYDSSGRITGTQLIFWDVTAEYDANKARREVQEELLLKNRDLTSLLYVISHDLKEPVRAIQSFAMLILDRHAQNLDEKGRSFLGRVVEASRRMQQLLDDVLMLSRAQRTVDPVDVVDLQAIVQDVLVQTQARIEETHATVTVVGTLPVVRGDRRWIIQAVLNLVVNALKFAQPGQPPEIEIAAFDVADEPGATSGFCVRDRGIGVDEAHRERIFELFQRAVSRNIEGTGAGLAIVRQVAEQHTGRAFVRPREGGGSEFVMTFGTDAV